MSSSNVFDDVTKALAAIGYHVTQAQIHQDYYGKHYTLSIEAIGPMAPGKVVAGGGLQLPGAPAVRAVPAKPTCECGAAKTGGMHSTWCPIYKP